MKNKLLIILLSIGVVFTQSCKDYLDTPAPDLSDAVYFSNDQAAITALAGAYDPMAWYGDMQLDDWAIGDVVSDDAEKGGENEGDQPDIQALRTFTANAENSVILGRWQIRYQGINRANKVIEGVSDNEKISTDVRKQVIAEAKFLRAFYMFELVKVFGGVPIVTKVLSPSEYTAPRNTEAECWAQIEKDLKEAAADLPKKSERVANNEVGRATWGAAKALLTKAYVFQKKWADADATATEIINSGEYQLDPDYGHIFTLDGDNGVESVWDIQYGDFNIGGWDRDNEGTTVCIFTRGRDNGGWGFVCPTQNLYDAFETGDPRREFTIIKEGDVLWAGTDDEEEFYIDAQNPTGYNSRKHILPASQQGQMSEDPLNWHYIRFAEVLLWQAEARAHNGGDWQTPLNLVRARVGLPATTETDGVKAVYHERREELALEAHRYWDLVRTGRGNLMNGYTDNKRFFLIPQVEINLNPNLEQNPY
ncbi:MAG: RagB/SusD family nutrient uptake outer membrane protein [Bacteroidales bacterium]|nr:RagB/SusD family nutrient uptake outer membrane protein [Bacteroidales bacterium]